MIINAKKRNYLKELLDSLNEGDVLIVEDDSGVKTMIFSDIEKLFHLSDYGITYHEPKELYDWLVKNKMKPVKVTFISRLEINIKG